VLAAAGKAGNLGPETRMRSALVDAISTWGTVSLVHEPPPLVAAMAVWNIAQGASDVQLFLDQPAPELRAMIGHLPQVGITDCDAGFWAGLPAGRPPYPRQRQNAVAALHYRRTSVDWLLHCDADEFVWDGAAPRRALAAQPAEVDTLVLPNLERVFRRGVGQRGLFDGDFRRPHRRRRFLSRMLYGPALEFLNGGVSGYSVGKSISRTGRSLKIGIHRAQPGRSGKAALVVGRAGECRLLHVDGIAPLHLKIKLLRRFSFVTEGGVKEMAPARRRLMERFAELAADRQALDRFCRAMTSLSGWQRLLLRARGTLRTLDFAPERLMAQTCPAALVTPAEFDAMLRQREPRLARLAEGPD
jgi:hypothetical protein